MILRNCQMICGEKDQKHSALQFVHLILEKILNSHRFLFMQLSELEPNPESGSLDLIVKIASQDNPCAFEYI